jgi:uroporphyrinogen-III synthase
MASLTRFCVALGRPHDQGEALARALERSGFEVLVAPLFDIRPIDPPPSLPPPGLLAFDLAFFVSANAVEQGWPCLCPNGQAWPAHTRAATVGPGSAKALVARGVSNVLFPASGFDTESVLALPDYAPHALKGKRVLLVRGEGGRPLLGDTLAIRGAEVTVFPVYERALPPGLPKAVVKAIRTETLDVFVVTSTQAVDHLVSLLIHESLHKPGDSLASIPLLVPHSRIEDKAKKAGFTRIHRCEIGDDALIQALESLRAKGSKKSPGSAMV